MGLKAIDTCAFDTNRFAVDQWHQLEQAHGLDLVATVAAMLTESTTASLPPQWAGRYSLERAAAWIAERDGESPTALAVERDSGEPVALMMLFEVPTERPSVDVRIGYLVDEAWWGRGVATELVQGLVDWAQLEPLVETLTGGVTRLNGASVRVLEKLGFDHIEDDGEEQIYQRRVD